MTGYAKAVKLARAFFGRAFRAAYVKPVQIEAEGVHLVHVGTAVQINYIAHGDPRGQERAHAFKKGQQPPLYVMGDGKVAFIMGRGMKFTGRGFVP